VGQLAPPEADGPTRGADTAGFAITMAILLRRAALTILGFLRLTGTSELELTIRQCPRRAEVCTFWCKITRTVHPVVPPHVGYALTPLGRSTLPIIESLREWGASYRAKRR
jgi:hypothetical protein